MLLYGRELVSLNFIPELNNLPDTEDQITHVRSAYDKLIKARKRCSEIYHEQFLPQLIDQSVDKRDRCRPVRHAKLNLNDIVLLKEPLLKPSNCPMAIVTSYIMNDLGEVTAVEALKGSTRESVKRHVDTVIPLLTPDLSSSLGSMVAVPE